MSLAREFWKRIETLHAVTYFGDASRLAAKHAGLRGFWMGQFGFRASPLGPVGADVVEAAFANFAPAMVRRSLPDVWSYAEPSALLRARTIRRGYRVSAARRPGSPRDQQPIRSISAPTFRNRPTRSS
jgi:hypothetical protein